MLFVFVVDSSPLMLQSQRKSTTGLDRVRTYVEDFVARRRREQATKGERYMLVTTSTSAGLKTGVSDSAIGMLSALKQVHVESDCDLDLAIANALRLACEVRHASGKDDIYRGYDITAVDNTELVVIAHPLSVLDSGESRVDTFCGEEWRRDAMLWDLRVSLLVCPLSAAYAEPSKKNSFARLLAKRTGGTAATCASGRALQQALASISAHWLPSTSSASSAAAAAAASAAMLPRRARIEFNAADFSAIAYLNIPTNASGMWPILERTSIDPGNSVPQPRDSVPCVHIRREFAWKKKSLLENMLKHIRHDRLPIEFPFRGRQLDAMMSFLCGAVQPGGYLGVVTGDEVLCGLVERPEGPARVSGGSGWHFIPMPPYFTEFFEIHASLQSSSLVSVASIIDRTLDLVRKCPPYSIPSLRKMLLSLSFPPASVPLVDRVYSPMLKTATPVVEPGCISPTIKKALNKSVARAQQELSFAHTAVAVRVQSSQWSEPSLDAVREDINKLFGVKRATTVMRSVPSLHRSLSAGSSAVAGSAVTSVVSDASSLTARRIAAREAAHAKLAPAGSAEEDAKAPAVPIAIMGDYVHALAKEEKLRNPYADVERAASEAAFFASPFRIKRMGVDIIDEFDDEAVGQHVGNAQERSSRRKRTLERLKAAFSSIPKTRRTDLQKSSGGVSVWSFAQQLDFAARIRSARTETEINDTVEYVKSLGEAIRYSRARDGESYARLLNNRVLASQLRSIAQEAASA